MPAIFNERASLDSFGPETSTPPTGFYIVKFFGNGFRKKPRYLVPDYVRPRPTKDRPNQKDLGPPVWDSDSYYAFLFPTEAKAAAYAKHFRVADYSIISVDEAAKFK